MGKKVVLVGHCGPDNSYLRMTIRKAVPDVEILDADDSTELTRALETGDPELLLFNRELGYGFTPDTGVEAIRMIRLSQPTLKMMLVSNYPESQQAAEAAGALPGFGKRELGTSRVREILQAALESRGTSPIAKSEI